MTWSVEFYEKREGVRPAQLFVDGLEGKHKREALALIALVGERGNQLRPPHSKLVETGLFELRGHQVRIFYIFRPGRRIVLLDGMIKKQDEIPAEVKDRVRAYRKDAESREE
jgi:hypothetical protein